MNRILDSELQISVLENMLRSSNKRIALCHGVFDLLHPGHFEHFYQASKIADVLIVSVTADEFVNKGPGRPIFDLQTRMLAISRVKGVDYVVPSNHPTALKNLALLKPDIYVKGGDYQNSVNDITGMIDSETSFVLSYGGRIHFTDGFTSSSTMLINSELLPQDNEIRKWVKEFRNVSDLNEVLFWIDKLQTVEVSVLGETIVDVYTSCKPMSKSSKDPILAFHRFDTQIFPGGVLAIGDSCEKWSKKTFVSTVCGKDIETHLADFSRKSKFEISFIEAGDRPTILKHRYYDISSGNRVFEYYDFNPDPLSKDVQVEIFRSMEDRLKTNSLVLLADYGHGFFGEILIDKLTQSNCFLAVNTQANAGNRGFNTFAKYPRIDFLSLNGGELELELRQKNLDYNLVVPKIMKMKQCRNAVVTLGASGLLSFDQNGKSFWTPAFASKVIDKVGAGDSVLAISSMLSFLAAPVEIIGLLASVVAAFEVAQLGHANSLDTIMMKKYVKGLLG